MSQKTQYIGLRTDKKTNAVSNLHYLLQKTLDVPKIYHNQEKLVKPVYKQTTFCKVLETFSNYHWQTFKVQSIHDTTKKTFFRVV